MSHRNGDRSTAEPPYRDAVADIARCCLYEGYLLWPYHRAALKNQQRWTFGAVYPASCAEQLGECAELGTQVLFEGGPDTTVEVSVRFLQVLDRQVYQATEAGEHPVDRLQVDGQDHLTWQEATERERVLPTWTPARRPRLTVGLDQPAGVDREELRREDGSPAGALVRSWRELSGTVELEAEPVDAGLWRLTVSVRNHGDHPPVEPGARGARDRLAPYALVSTHLVLHSPDGRFASMTDPPEEYRSHSGTCRQRGVWPVLVDGGTTPGDQREDQRRATTVLAAPITLYDFPAVAPESPGDLFDGTEIDRLLILSVLSMSAEERREAAASDPEVRRMLERCESLEPDQLLALQGTIRERRPLEER
ncbi:hypothetical protein [Streptomyces sp. NPDC005438]|uniref:hypothetical protein n=1 Tax=Streptomyces sp. NPDC005438 TaxID=3156880 RepID=UPI0033BE0C29